jgi:uncharacterized protein
MESPMDVEMKIRGLVMDPATSMPIVILKDIQGETVLPIWVGLYEANAIALEIEKSTPPRPMTHDLLRNLVCGLNASVQKVVVTELKNDTFYAVIWMEQDGEVISLDARFMSAKRSSASPSWLRAWRKPIRKNCAVGLRA